MSRALPLVALVRRLRSITCLQIALATLVLYLLSSLFDGSETFALCVLPMLPVVAFVGLIFELQMRFEIIDDDVVQIFATILGGIYPGIAFSSFLELVIAPLFAILCFYDQRDAIVPQLRTFLDHGRHNSSSESPAPPHSARIGNLLVAVQVRKTFGYYLFIVLSAFFVTGVVQEATKLWLVQTKCLLYHCSSGARRFQTNHADRHIVIVLTVTAAAIGFSFIENVAITFRKPAFNGRLFVVVVRSLVNLPLHTMCGAMTGMRLARAGLMPQSTSGSCVSLRQNAWILAPAVLVHGSFDLLCLVAVSFSSDKSADVYTEIFGVLVPFVLSFAVGYGAVMLAKREWLALNAAKAQSEYEALGRATEYGEVVSDSDDDDGDDDTSMPQRATQSVQLV